MNYFNTLNYGNKILKSKNISTYRLDSELLLAKVLNKTREQILTNLSFSLKQNEFHNFKRLLLRRKEKEPIAYIFKQKEFWKYSFVVNRDVDWICNYKYQC